MAKIQIEYHYNEYPSTDETILEQMNDRAIEQIADLLQQQMTQGTITYFDETTNKFYDGWASLIYISGE